MGANKLIIFILLILSISSCHFLSKSKKELYIEKGIRKGYIDTLTKKFESNDSIQLVSDTIFLEKQIDSIVNILVNVPCDSALRIKYINSSRGSIKNIVTNTVYKECSIDTTILRSFDNRLKVKTQIIIKDGLLVINQSINSKEIECTECVSWFKDIKTGILFGFCFMMLIYIVPTLIRKR